MKFLTVAIMGLCTPLGLGAVIIGQADTFQSGTLHNWARGGAALAPVNISTGGPDGAGDRYMRLLSDGGGINGKMLAFNNLQWSGDLSAVPAISVDFNNLGSTELTMRLSFRDTTGAGGGGFITSDSVTLAAGSGWQKKTFDLSDLVSIGTLVPEGVFMTNVAQMRILHAPDPSTLLGEEVEATLGIDNISAVPEPSSSLALGLIGVFGLTMFRRRA